MMTQWVSGNGIAGNDDVGGMDIEYAASCV
jgi:hypothetical protein